MMTDEVRESYDAMAERYASLFLTSIDSDANAKRWLGRFAGRALQRVEQSLGLNGVVADLGCGPGHITNHLTGLGLNAVGYDLSPGQIAEARRFFPELSFEVGDFTALNAPDSFFDGIVSRYSLIHTPPDNHGEVFREWLRVLKPGAPILVSFFGSTSAQDHGTPFDHTVVTAYELFPGSMAETLEDVGFTDLTIGTRPPQEGGRPFDQATILATKPRPLR